MKYMTGLMIKTSLPGEMFGGNNRQDTKDAEVEKNIRRLRRLHRLGELRTTHGA
jgi:hypothetical protein